MKWILFQSIIRLRFVIVCFAILFSLIICRIFYIQFFQTEMLTEKAKENWDREIPFMAKRGDILDRNGEKLVTNELAPTLYFMPAQNPNVEEVAETLSSYLDISTEKLTQQLSKRTYLIRLFPEGKNITPQLGQQIAQLKIPGVYVTMDYKRTYPFNMMLARLLGFTGADYTGLAGLEYAYNDILQGDNHAIRLYTDAKGQQLEHIESEWNEGEDGANVQLTIDAELQQIVERELNQAMLEYNADQALAIAMDPNTGEILALASLPSFDPQNYNQVSPSIYNQNLPVFMTYEPGSTFKIITLAAAVEEGVVDLQKDHFHDIGHALVEGVKLRCWKRSGHGDQTFLQVVENSCNPGFIELGQRVGKDKLYDYIKSFGFGESTNSTIAGEAKGILFSKESFGPVEHATTSFGQGISVTPIQQVQAVSAVINGGNLIEPSIVKKITDSSNTKVLYEHEPIVKRTVISPSTSETIRSALESVVANGSGRAAFRDGLRIGGKTGTAQKAENGRYLEGNYIVSFIGFAPATNPKIVVYVAVDNPKSHTVFGSTIAAPIVGTIIEEVADRYNIEKDLNQLPRKYVWGDTLAERMPNFIGLKKTDMVNEYYPYKIQWHGTGDTIIDQLPKADELMNQDEVVHLFLSE